MKPGFCLATVVSIFLVVPFTGCERTQTVIKDKVNVLGAFAHITIADVPAPEARSIAQTVEQDLRQLDHVGYTFAPEGELHELNEAIAEGKPKTVSTELRALIENAKRLYTASRGLFNPAAGELVALWEFHCNKADCTEYSYSEEVRRLVDEKDAWVVARRPSMDDITLDGNTVTSGNPSVKLEFGDMIRGYALDKGIDHLRKLGVRNAMIELGGIARSVGSRGQHPWWSPIWDASGKRSAGHVELNKGEAIATVRAFDRSIGKREFVYRHVMNPWTGTPVRDVKAVTVIHDNAVWADAAATALLVAGIDDWTPIAEKMGVRSVMMVAQDGTIYTSTTMEERIHWNQRLEHQHLVPRRR